MSARLWRGVHDHALPQQQSSILQVLLHRLEECRRQIVRPDQHCAATDAACPDQHLDGASKAAGDGIGVSGRRARQRNIRQFPRWKALRSKPCLSLQNDGETHGTNLVLP